MLLEAGAKALKAVDRVSINLGFENTRLPWAFTQKAEIRQDVLTPHVVPYY